MWVPLRGIGSSLSSCPFLKCLLCPQGEWGARLGSEKSHEMVLQALTGWGENSLPSAAVHAPPPHASLTPIPPHHLPGALRTASSASQPLRLWLGWLVPFMCRPWFCASFQCSCSLTSGLTEAGPPARNPLATVLGNEGRCALQHSLPPPPI